MKIFEQHAIDQEKDRLISVHGKNYQNHRYLWRITHGLSFVFVLVASLFSWLGFTGAPGNYTMLAVATVAALLFSATSSPKDIYLLYRGKIPYMIPSGKPNSFYALMSMWPLVVLALIFPLAGKLPDPSFALGAAILAMFLCQQLQKLSIKWQRKLVAKDLQKVGRYIASYEVCYKLCEIQKIHIGSWRTALEALDDSAFYDFADVVEDAYQAFLTEKEAKQAKQAATKKLTDAQQAEHLAIYKHQTSTDNLASAKRLLKEHADAVNVSV